MVNPVPGYKITTPFGKKGSSWATGVHGGDDWAAPRGTDVVAPWGGTVSGVRVGSSRSGTTWGSAFGSQVVIDFDRLPDGSAGLWGVLAHLSKVDVKVGQRVEAGQKIGEVGSTGNSTGNHLHFEVQPQRGWVRGSYRDPERWVNAQKESTMADEYGFDGDNKELVIGRSYVRFSTNWNPKRDGLQFAKRYSKGKPVFYAGKEAGSLRFKCVRTNPTDPTFYHDEGVSADMLDDDGFFLRSFSSFESGQHERDLYWMVKCVGGMKSCTITASHYAGFAVQD